MLIKSNLFFRPADINPNAFVNLEGIVLYLI